MKKDTIQSQFPATRQECEEIFGGVCPDCQQVHPAFISSLCHPGEPLFAHYENGVVILTCAECDKPVLKVLVADRIKES